VGESLLLAGAAGLVGVLLARLAVGALVALAPPDLPRLDEVALGAGTLLVTAVLVVASGLLLGLLPLWRGGASAPASALSEGGRGAATGRSGRVRSALVVAQVALALVLVTASGLMLRTFAHLTAVDPGFDADGLVVFDLSLPTSRYTDVDAVYDAHRELLTRLEATPGVDAAGAANGVPILGGGFCVAVNFEDVTTGEAVSRGCPEVRFVSPGYFEAMGIRLDEGRTFEHADNDSRAAPLVVSRAMAAQLWPGLDALGRGARLWGEGYFRVVGVVGDVRGAGLTDPVTPTLYYPLRPPPGESMPSLNAMTYVVRADAGTAVAGTLREVVGAFDPDLPVASVRAMDEVVGRSMIRTTFTLLLMGIAGSLALGLALVGLYGVVAYTVSRRTPELGIRMALGASAGRVRAAVLGHAAALVLVGAVLGIGLARAATGFLAAGLHGVSANDPVTFAAAAGTLILVALLAAWLPARRATRIDPSSALRAE
jgi:predicted permease